jgi:hypothetical protein
MPISSHRLLLANDHIHFAIAHAQLAADLVRDQQNELHMLALKESRITGLIDVVRWETRLREALLTLKGLRDTPSVGLPVQGSVPTGFGGGDLSVDEQSSGSDELARSRPCSFTPSDGQGYAAFNELLKACGYGVYCTDRDSPIGMEV